MSINTEFNKFISNNLTLDQKDISSAVSSREWLINKVINKIAEKTDCPQLYSENGSKYIQFGSYFKGTKVSNVDEFDILLIVDTSHGIFKKGNITKGNGIGNLTVNPLYLKKYYKENEDVVSSRKLLNWLKDIVDEVLEPYECEPSERDGQAVTAYIKSKNLHIDFVPGCIFQDVNTSGSDGVFYIIPKGDINCGWIVTNPRIDKDIIKDKSSINSQFKNTIRLFKYLFKDSYNVQIGSYAVESAVVDYEDKKFFWNDYGYDFLGVLNHIIDLVEDGNIPDMRDNSINLLGDVNKDALLTKLNNIKNRYNKLDEFSDTFSEDVEDFLKNE
ncbi:MAG: hypothetical protein SOT71_02895 [Romboutsia timonensis]|uniref:hypothetical protein n=1 Tax=Romboutsia timonensis TaxID=1776391 RepID=UPI002A752452|nr:hypothetical protein [Romboutsia timonensis]MDY2881583.1 hypothetical protein [Romboutsia timonensis]